MKPGWEMRWPKEKEDKLREMWAAGFSATLIGKELGHTRTAILGKTHRLKLGGHTVKHSEARPANPKGRNAKYRARKKAGEDTSRRIVVKRGDRQNVVLPSVELTKSELRAMLHQAVLNTARAA
jgi:hypothetical protein